MVEGFSFGLYQIFKTSENWPSRVTWLNWYRTTLQMRNTGPSLQVENTMYLQYLGEPYCNLKAQMESCCCRHVCIARLSVVVLGIKYRFERITPSGYSAAHTPWTEKLDHCEDAYGGLELAPALLSKHTRHFPCLELFMNRLVYNCILSTAPLYSPQQRARSTMLLVGCGEQ
jgi:hypothetical protein